MNCTIAHCFTEECHFEFHLQRRRDTEFKLLEIAGDDLA